MHSRFWAAVIFTACAAASTVVGQVVPTHANVHYGDGGVRQVLDIYLPVGPVPAGGRPVVVWIHGGGWQNGDKASAAGRAAQLMPLGFAVVGINYRLSGTYSHPAQINDCKGAIRWLRSHAAEYGLDDLRFGVWGSSAGGHLVALVGTSGDAEGIEGTVGGNEGKSSRVQAVVDYFGPADMMAITTIGHLSCASPESAMLGVCLGDVVANQNDPAWADDVALVNSASPRFYVSADDPPFHIAHGTSDPVVEMNQSVLLHGSLSAAGVVATLRLIPGDGHGLPQGEDTHSRRFLACQLSTTYCEGDWDANGIRNVPDIFAYLNNWFAGDLAADQDGSGVLGVPEIFEFLSAWFAPCG